MMKIIYFIIIPILLFSCEVIVDWEEPEFLDGSILSETNQIDESVKTKLEGVYKIIDGSDHFGEEVVFKWYDNTLSVFGSKSGTYLQLEGGEKDSEFFFEGTWRHFLSAEGGLVRLFFNKNNGSAKLLDSSLTAISINLSGSYGKDESPLSSELTLEYVRPFNQDLLEKDFYILAHRGGGRNSDYLGASENSLEIISLSENLGANGIEIDVKLSEDNIPFLYHDETINLRLARESLIWGPIEDFTFSQIRIFVRLKNGERIPSLKEALEFVLYETNLKFVWLDMKSEKNAMAEVIEIQQSILQQALVIGRDLEIMIGLPSDDKANIFMKYPSFENITSLCELSKDITRKSNSQIWAPRWTLGTQNESVLEMQNEGRRAFTWTLDQTEFISQFIKESNFDGILTNYPTIVAYYHYAR